MAQGLLMPVYAYKGWRADGRSTVGIVDAESLRSARLKLRQDGVYPTDVVEADAGHRTAGADGRVPRSPFVRAVTGQDLANVTRQLGTLLVAGVPLIDALAVLIDQSETKILRTVIADVREQIREGRALSHALERHPSLFPPLFVHMVHAGEASGSLDQILLQLADHAEAQVALKQKLVNAAVYPALMLVVSVAVLFFLMTFVVPKITVVFADLHQVLPWPTRALMAVSDLLGTSWWLLLVAGVLLVGVVRRWLQTAPGRRTGDALLLKIPLLGPMVRKVAIARLTGTLATMLSSGVPLLTALDVAKRVMNNVVLEEAVDTARQNIREGETIADPLKRSGAFPPLVTQLVAIGEKSGELEIMLKRVTEIYTRDVDRLIARLTSLLEPLMILAMGSVVLFIVLAILLPIFEMSQMAR